MKNDILIGLASDHAGYELKQFVKQYLDEHDMAYKDYGTYSEESCDYPDFGHALARGIEQGEVYPGIAIPEIAHLIRQHNDANVLVMPGRFIDTDTARAIMDEFFATPFEGGRHQKRVEKIPLKSV